MLQNIKCPNCGSETIVRTAKKGSNAGSTFHVCVRYPECKGKVLAQHQTEFEQNKPFWKATPELKKQPDKSKGKGDIQQLEKSLKSDKLQVRVDTVEAITDLDDLSAIDLLINEFSNILKFGDDADKIQCITIIQGRASENGLVGIAVSVDYSTYMKIRIKDLLKVKFRKKLDLNIARPVLLNYTNDSTESITLRWYALVALVELGDRSDEVLSLLIDVLNTMPQKDVCTLEESIRTLSYFASNPDIINMLIDIAKGPVFGTKHEYATRSAAIYALGVTGDTSAREYLEYIATHDDKYYRKKAQVALKLFGKAIYDEIEAQAKTES